MTKTWRVPILLGVFSCMAWLVGCQASDDKSAPPPKDQPVSQQPAPPAKEPPSTEKPPSMPPIDEEVESKAKAVKHMETKKPTIEGVIVDIDQHGMLVEGKSGTSPGKGKFYFRKDTELYYLDGSKYKKGDLKDLQKGSRVKVWSIDPIMESYPYQTKVKYVLVEKTKK